MRWLARSKNHQDRVHLLSEHLRSVADEAAQLALLFSKSDIAQAVGYLVGIFHDLGKYEGLFQERVHGLTKETTEHAIVGAAYLFSQFTKNPILGYLTSILVMSHHTGLPNNTHWKNKLLEYGTERNGRPDELFHRMMSDMPPVQAKIDSALGVLQSASPFSLDSWTDKLRFESTVRMLFSALVDADYLDTERHFNPYQAVQRGLSILSSVLPRIDFGSFPATTKVSRVRTEMFAQALAKSNDSVGLFRLAIPTGGGKTRTALAFAIEHAKANALNRIVTAIPYTSIIEQTAFEYNRWIPQEAILEHHYLAEGHGAARLAAENWDMPIVLTTHVQLFESLFGHSPGQCRKLHNMANSVIIIDEIQNLPVKLLPILVPCMKILSEEYHMSFIFCTATQPFLSFFEEGQTLEITNLVEGENEYRAILQRAIIDPICMHYDHSISSLAEEVACLHQSLVICNHKREVEQLCDEINQRTDQSVFVLTTSLYPTHRSQIVEEIRTRLKNRQPCIVVATQLIEAGVDVDFPIVYRELAPLERIIQAAGRVNREGELRDEEGNKVMGKCIVFSLTGVSPLSEEQSAVAVTRNIFMKYPTATFQESKIIDEYFEMVYLLFRSLANKQTQEIQTAIETLDFPTISQKMRIIDQDDDLVPAVVAVGVDQKQVNSLVTDIRRKEFVAREDWRKLGSYMVSVRKSKNRDFIEEILPDTHLFLWRGEYDPMKGAAVVT